MHIGLPFGLRNNRLVHISEIQDHERGLKCNCICVRCHSPLMAKLGEVNIHHFAHLHEECANALESALHVFAKQVLEGQRRLKLPRVDYDYRGMQGELYHEDYYEFDEVVSERRLDTIIPDLLLRKNTHELIIEIKVTHGVDQEKLRKIKGLNISTLEINLGSVGLQYNKFDPTKITDLIINNTSIKSWVYNTKIEKKKREIDLIVKQKAEEERRLRMAAEKAQAERIVRVVKLLRPEYQKSVKEKWAHEISHDACWDRLATELNIDLHSIPNYLNKEIEGEFVFACDRRIWQATLFSQYVFKKHVKGNSRYIVVRYVLDWLQTKPYPLPLHWDLIYLKNIERFKYYPTLANVVCDYFVYLSNYGFIIPKYFNRPVDPYYWQFERFEDELKLLPEKFHTDRFIEHKNMLMVKGTKYKVGYLRDIYVARR